MFSIKKGKLLNSEISYCISKMGHTDTLIIADAGLPIPNGVQRIDLALKRAIPSFLDTLEAVLSELKVEKVFIAKELPEVNPDFYGKICAMLSGIEIEYISHDELKERSGAAKCVIRTGECSSFANIILQSGVVF